MPAVTYAHIVQTAVAFFIFNRPTLTEQVFEAIAAARPARLLVVGDGPRSDHPEDAELVTKARRVIDRVDWPCEVFTCYSERNLGCKQRVATGLDWVFSQVPEAIILEDDTVPDETFFPYCEHLLVRYRDDERVHMVSGFTMFEPGEATTDSYYFSRCYHVWGWASWARAWSHYDLHMRRWPEVRDTSWLEDLLGGPTEARIEREIFDLTYAGRVTTWDFQWVFSSWLSGGLSVIPGANLITNIGYGPLATNESNADHPFARAPRYPMQFPLRHPDEVDVLRTADAAEWRFVYPTYFRPDETARGSRWRELTRHWRSRYLRGGRLAAAKHE
jgi:hypothetical protein